MTITVVATGALDQASSLTHVINMGTTPLAGDVIVLASYRPNRNIASVSGPTGAVWTQQFEKAFNSANQRHTFWTATGATASGNITVTLQTLAQVGRLEWWLVRGLPAAFRVVGVTSTPYQSASNTDSQTIGSTYGGEALVMVHGVANSSGAWTWGGTGSTSGWTATSSQYSASNYGGAAYKILAAGAGSTEAWNASVPNLTGYSDQTMFAITGVQGAQALQTKVEALTRATPSAQLLAQQLEAMTRANPDAQVLQAAIEAMTQVPPGATDARVHGLYLEVMTQMTSPDYWHGWGMVVPGV